jgi:hypothetical protein
MYMLWIIYIRHGGILSLISMSFHSALQSTRSYALLRSTKISPSGDFENIL